MDGGNAHAEAVSVTRRRAKNETLKAGRDGTPQPKAVNKRNVSQR
jgi:hypothetical protein